MKYLILLLLAGCSCASQRPVMVVPTEDTHLDHDQVVICAYVDAKRALVCMTPEEYQVRVDANTP